MYLLHLKCDIKKSLGTQFAEQVFLLIMVIKTSVALSKCPVIQNPPIVS